jgi:hypothetical protein
MLGYWRMQILLKGTPSCREYIVIVLDFDLAKREVSR